MTWDDLIKEYEDFENNALYRLNSLLNKKRINGKIIYPAQPDIFKAFDLTPFEKIKIVILGQDPYYNPGQAHGLAFSVPKGIKKPPSLQNIFKELNKDLNIPEPKDGDLSEWAKRGVLLLNTILTVEKDKPLSHRNLGWDKFTTFILKKIAENSTPKVFLLWGKRSHDILKDKEFHKNSLVLKCGHPSPLSYRFYMDNNHFSIANIFLEKNGIAPVNWDLNEVKDYVEIE